MTGYLVELRGESREVYYIEADSAEEAENSWEQGSIVVAEAFGMDVYSVKESE